MRTHRLRVGLLNFIEIAPAVAESRISSERLGYTLRERVSFTELIHDDERAEAVDGHGLLIFDSVSALNVLSLSFFK